MQIPREPRELMGTNGLVVLFSNVYVVGPSRIGLFSSNDITLWIGYTLVAQAREVRLGFNTVIYSSLLMSGLSRGENGCVLNTEM